jgi:methionyl aminopeptidase
LVGIRSKAVKGIAVHILRSIREINLMRKAGLLVWEAHQRVRSLVRPGVTTQEIDHAVAAFFAEREATPLFKGVPSDKGGPFPAVCCMSVNEEVVHGIPGSRVLKEGDIISVDTGCRIDGWCGDAANTYTVGQISAEVQRLLDVTLGTLELAIDLLGKKSRWSQVAEQMGAYVRDNGFSTVENFVGHGIGRNMHEEPQVPNYVSPQLLRNGDFALEPGLVIAIEPMVNMGTKKVKQQSDHWTQSTADGLPSAHFEHTVAITDRGVWVLTDPPSVGPGEHVPAIAVPEVKPRKLVRGR